MIRYLKALVAARNIVRLDGPISGDLVIERVFKDADGDVVRVLHCLEADQEGMQSLFWDNRRGHAIVQVIPNQFSGTVDLRVIRNLGLDLATIQKPWLSGWLGEVPEDFGIEEYSAITLSNRTKAWLIPAESKDWVIHIHGRKAAKGETLRNLDQFRRTNFNQLVISHESDPKPDGLGTKVSYLGEREWKQVEVAVEEAQQRGSERIVIFGWSLGAMIAGQFIRHSQQKSLVSGIILDSPLIDYETTLQLQAKNAGYDSEFGSYVYQVLSKSWLLKLFGLQRSEIPSLLIPIAVPMLVLYSASDGYVSMAKIDEMLSLNKQAISVEISDARHCRLFNKDKVLYQNAISDFIGRLHT